jgi:hypothetical protein
LNNIEVAASTPEEVQQPPLKEGSAEKRSQFSHVVWEGIFP